MAHQFMMLKLQGTIRFQSSNEMWSVTKGQIIMQKFNNKYYIRCEDPQHTQVELSRGKWMFRASKLKGVHSKARVIQITLASELHIQMTFEIDSVKDQGKAAVLFLQRALEDE